MLFFFCSYLQLLEPGKYVWLLKALNGLLMLLPQQSAAFKILNTRLKTVPSIHFSEDGNMNDDSISISPNGINFASWLQRFQRLQQQHRLHCKSLNTSTSSKVGVVLCCMPDHHATYNFKKK